MRIHISRKHCIRLILVIAVAVLLEVLVFNFSALAGKADSSIQKNIVFTLSDMKKTNWKQQGKEYVSEPDPMLIIPKVNMKVKNLTIEPVEDKTVGQVVVFYTNSKIPIFSAQGMVVTGSFSSENAIDINQQVQSLRIDLGEDAGLKLKDIKVTINPVHFDFSISRVIAIVLIYLCAVFLFGLQKSPDYGMQRRKD